MNLMKKELILCEFTILQLQCKEVVLSSNFSVDNVNFSRFELMICISTIF